MAVLHPGEAANPAASQSERLEASAVPALPRGPGEFMERAPRLQATWEGGRNWVPMLVE